MNEQRDSSGDGLWAGVSGVLLLLLAAVSAFGWLEYRQTQRLSREVEQLQLTIRMTSNLNERLAQLRQIADQCRANRDALDTDARGQLQRKQLDGYLDQYEAEILKRERERDTSLRKSIDHAAALAAVRTRKPGSAPMNEHRSSTNERIWIGLYILLVLLFAGAASFGYMQLRGANTAFEIALTAQHDAEAQANAHYLTTERAADLSIKVHELEQRVGELEAENHELRQQLNEAGE